MKTTSHFLLATALLAALAFTFSCSGGDDNGDPQGNAQESSSSGDVQASNPSSSSSQPNNPSSSGGIDSGAPITKAKIAGVFQKGPFVEGANATLNELNSDLSPTGRPYPTLITDNKGSFELNNVELVSPYAHLIATGYFQNEVTGKKSDGTITLQAIVDVTDKDNINVNVITHLEYYRVLNLVERGMTVKAAKKQAQKEIFAVFGIDSNNFKDSEDMTIFGTSESDAALLAVSVLLLGDLREADFTQRLMNFSQGIRNNGEWENEEEKTKMADWVSGDLGSMSITNVGKYCYYGPYNPENADVKGCWSMPTQDNCITGKLVDYCIDDNVPIHNLISNIKSNILGWGLFSEIPPFEKYLRNYWAENYGLGECKAEFNDVMKQNVNPNSDRNSYDFICNGSYWEIVIPSLAARFHAPSI
jgi:hypothetical protein